jgi:hypothetical protein
MTEDLLDKLECNELSHVLIAYKGGGYEGCFWEWNYALYVDGKFYDIHSSGHDGCKSDVAMYDHVAAGNDVTLYDTTNVQDMEKLQRTEACDNVMGIVANGNSIYEMLGLEPPFFFKCDECGDHVYTEGELEGMRGCGGIAIVHDCMLCNDCYRNGTCEECGEYTPISNRGRFWSETCLCTDCDYTAVFDGITRGEFDSDTPVLAEIAAEVLDIHTAITRGKWQVAAMCELMPEKEDQIRAIHAANVNTFNLEAYELCREYKDESA